jgi:replicative DNA helicase
MTFTKKININTTQFDDNLEKAILGSILLNSDHKYKFMKEITNLQPKHFYDEARGQIYGICQEMMNEQIIIDQINVKHHAKANHNLIITNEELTECIVHSIMVSNPSFSAQHLIELYKKREIEKQIQNLDDENVDDFVEKINNIQNEVENTNFDDLFLSNEEMYNQYIYDKANKKQSFAWQPQLPKINLEIPKSGLIVIAARAKVGKTTLALQFAKQLSYEAKTVFFSLEMRQNDILDKYLALPTKTTGGVNPLVLKHSEDPEKVITSSNQSHIHKAFLEYQEADIKFIHQKMTVDNILSAIRVSKRRGYEVFVIDQLSKIFHENYKMTTKQKYDEIVDKLSRFCKEEKVLIILLSQCNRSVDMREEKTPRDSDISDTDRLLQEADILLVGAWQDQEKTKANWLVVDRNGKGGLTELEWNSKTANYNIYN